VTGWRTALRIARRELRRSKGRSALVVALIGLPVCGVSFAAVSYDSSRVTVAQQVDRELGAADATVRWEWDGPVGQRPDVWSFAHAGDVPRRTDPVTAEDLRTVLPANSRVVPHVTGEIGVRTPAGVTAMAAEVVDLRNPIHHGRVVLRDGRAPVGSGEAAITARAADRLDATIGNEVASADGEHRWTVTGIVEYPAGFRPGLLLPPGALPGQPPPEQWFVATSAPVTWQDVRQLNQHGITVRSRAVLLDPPPPGDLDDRFVTADRSGPDAAVVTVGAVAVGLTLLEVVLLAGPAFAVTARRRQRDLALVAAAGGTPAQMRRLMLADGVLLGAAGAVAGITIGLLLAVAGLPLLEQHLLGRRGGGVQVFPVALVGAAALAVLAGLLAALTPAALAARQPVVAMLGSRRGVVRSRPRWAVLGVAGIVAGAALAAAGGWRVHAGLMLAGLAMLQLGLVLCTPTMLGAAARAGRFLPLAPRIALRDTARHRAAATPAVAAVMAAVAGALTLAVYLEADRHRQVAAHAPGAPTGHAWVAYDHVDPAGHAGASPERHQLVVDALSGTLPEARVVPVQRPRCGGDGEHCQLTVQRPERHRCPWLALEVPYNQPGTMSTYVELSRGDQRSARQDPRCDVPDRIQGPVFPTVVDHDGAVLAALAGPEPDDLAAAVGVLRAGGVVVTDPHLLDGDRATLEVVDHPGMGRDVRARLTVPAHALSTATAQRTLFVSPSALERTGLAPAPAGVVAAGPRAITEEEQDAAYARLRAVDPALSLQVERGPSHVPAVAAVILAVAAGMVVLGAAGIATGLAAADRRPDLVTLAAVGGDPRTRRLLSLSQAGVIAGVGTVLGTVAGLGAASAVLFALNQRYAAVFPAPEPYPLAVPWSALAVLLTVPLAAMLGAGLLTSSRLPAERRPA
jgi:putative ABC transport system permease protein